MSKRKHPGRHELRAARHERKRQAAGLRSYLDEAGSAYVKAILYGWVQGECDVRGIDKRRVVCEGCGLEQEYLTANHFENEDLELYPCPGTLDLECGHEYCVTAEAYAA